MARLARREAKDRLDSVRVVREIVAPIAFPILCVDRVTRVRGPNVLNVEATREPLAARRSAGLRRATIAATR